MHRQRIAIVFAAAAGMMATFLPWVKIPFIGTVYGTEGDGWITFGLFLISFSMACLGDKTIAVRSTRLLGTVIPAILAVIMGFWKLTDSNTISKTKGSAGEGTASPQFEVSFEIGLYVMIISGVMLTLFALLLNIKYKKTLLVQKKVKIVEEL